MYPALFNGGRYSCGRRSVMIFFIIGILILAWGIFDFKKAFISFLVFDLFLVQNVSVVAIPGIPLLTLDHFMMMAFLVLFVLRRKNIDVEKVQFPLWRPFIFIAISYLLSTVFSYAGFGMDVSAYIKDMTTHFLIVWMMWCVVSASDTRTVFKWITVAFLAISIYGLYEYFTHTNPLADYETTLMPDESRLIDFTYSEESYRGYRIKSVFEHAIGAGMNWGLYITFVITLLYKYKFRVNIGVRNLSIIAALLAFGCLLFTNSRGPIMFFFLTIFCWLDLRNTRIYGLFVMAAILVFLFRDYLFQYANNVLSIVNSEAQEEVGGSNAEMRFDQLDAAWQLMQRSPVFGLGYKFQNEMDTMLTSRLLGGESMWFRILPCFGFLGIIANVYFFYYSAVVIPKKFRSRPIFFLTLAYWVTASLTSIPGYITILHYLAIILFIKITPQYAKMCEGKEQGVQ